MKTKIISIVVMLLMACNVMGEDLISIYKNDGSIITLPFKEIDKFKTTKKDVDGVMHNDYQSLQFAIGDSLYYISINDVDSILFVKKDITHYPQTEEEMKESVNISYRVKNRVDQILDSVAYLEDKDVAVIVKEICNLPEVITAMYNSSKTCISILQKDSMQINYFLRTIDTIDYPNEKNDNNNSEKKRVNTPSLHFTNNSNSQGTYSLTDNNIFLSAKKGLIISPFLDMIGFSLEAYKEWVESLFDFRIDILTDGNYLVDGGKTEKADIEYFLGSNLSKYDMILFLSHGGSILRLAEYNNYWIKKSYTTGDKIECSIIISNTVFDFNSAEYYRKKKLLPEMAVSSIPNDEKLYFGMTPSFLDGSKFNNSSILALCCETAKIQSGKGSMMQKFFDVGASFYCGFSEVSDNMYAQLIANKLPDYWAKCFSIEGACDYFHNSTYFLDQLNCFVEIVKRDPDLSSEEIEMIIENYHSSNFVYKINPRLFDHSFYYKDYFPHLKDANIEIGKVKLSWEKGPNSFTDSWIFLDESSEISDRNIDLNVEYDIYINGKKVEDSYTETSYNWTPNMNGTNKWYVVARLMEGNEEIVSYRSEDGSFNYVIDYLVVSQSSVDIKAGSSTTVEITSGNGSYTVSVDKPTIATATLSGTTITIKGVAKGTAKVTVKDKSGQTAEIIVTVISANELLLSQSVVNISVGAEATVEIISGNGDYSLAIDDSSIATYSLSGSIITVKGICVGTAVVTVTDNVTKQNKSFFVNVSLKDCPIAEAIDLGLPSGTKWASWNVGASKPEEYGGYYAWGETETKDYNNYSTYKYCKGSDYTMTKYCTQSSCGYNGYTDWMTELSPEDDAATANWGAPWHIPTTTQQEELNLYCTREWKQLNGVNGILVTGPNGNTIFLPAAGNRYNDSLHNEGYWGYYWSSSLDPYEPYSACFLYYDFDWWYFYDSYRRIYGMSVRPVCP